MRIKVSPESAIRFTKASVALSGNWPPPSDATSSKRLFFEIYWWTAFLLSILLLVPLLYAVYVFRDDFTMMAKVMCAANGIFHIGIKMAVCKVYRTRFQRLIFEVEDFLRCADLHQRQILQRYVNRVTLFHGFITFAFYSISIAITFGPLIMREGFPMDAKYPFGIENHPVFDIVYLQQVIGVLQASAACTTDCQLGVLLWFTSARFEMLIQDFENVVHNSELNSCIRKHQELLQYADEVRIVVRFIVLTTVGVLTISLILSGVQLVANQPFIVKLQYGLVVVCAAIELYICAWPSNNLSEMSAAVGWAAYNSSWIGKSQKMLKSLLIISYRSQKPVIINVGGLLPALSLSYYTTFLSTAFSYFTTLRLMIDKENA